MKIAINIFNLIGMSGLAVIFAIGGNWDAAAGWFCACLYVFTSLLSELE